MAEVTDYSWREKYTAKVWRIESPEGRYQGVLTMDKAVSLEWMARRFPNWKCRALFDHEHEVGLGKARRHVSSKEDDDE